MNIDELNDELVHAVINFSSYHAKMKQNRDFYISSAYFEREAGQKAIKNDPRANMLRVFADKNIEYTSDPGKMKVLTTGADQQVRQAASLREKIILATREKNMYPLLRKKFAFDATVFSVAVCETRADWKNRCVRLRRYDPRFCFWQLSNDNERRVIAFWVVYPMTKDEVFKRFGVTPKFDKIANATVEHELLNHIDGREWFTYAIRWDEKTRTSWVGDKMIEKRHPHQQAGVPVDICTPIYDGDTQQHGAFYLDPLISLQAELNQALFKRQRIVRRLGSPVAWVRGMQGKRLDEIRREFEREGGGAIGLTRDGEAGFLQLQETNMIDNHINDLIQQMMRLSGYGNAAFGENVGANTSGDALGMYFNATQRKIEHQNISWVAFEKSINAKILELYEIMGRTGEQFNLSGYSPEGTLMPITNDKGDTEQQYQRGGIFDVTFDASVIEGNYNSVVVPKNPLPKNELEEKRLAIEAVRDKFLSRTTGYEEFGILSPEDELALLQAEQSEPLLNPEGTQQIMQGMEGGGMPGAPGAGAMPGAPPAAGLPPDVAPPPGGGGAGLPAPLPPPGGAPYGP